MFLRLLWLFDRKKASIAASIDPLFSYLYSLIVKKDLVKDIWKEKGKAINRAVSGDYRASIAVCKKLEECIVSPAPPVTKGKYTQESLHADVMAQPFIKNLPFDLRFLFASESTRQYLFFTVITRDLIKHICDKVGEPKLVSLVGEAMKATPFTGVSVSQKGLDFSSIHLPDGLSPEELINIFRLLYVTIYNEARSLFGGETVLAIVRGTYLSAEAYGPATVKEFFTYLPEGVLMTERVTYLSKQAHVQETAYGVGEVTPSVPKTGDSMTNDPVGKEEHEAQYKVLEDTKKAMLNLLEDAKRLEVTLKSERDRATAIVSAMGEGLFVVDAGYHVLLVNPAAEKMLGLHMNDIIGKNLSEVTTLMKGDTPLAQADRPLAKTMASGQSMEAGMEGDYYLKTPERNIPISLTTSALNSGEKITGGLVTFHDITRDKEVKETIERTVEERTQELRQEQARLTASINSLVVGFILTSPTGDIITKNPASVSILEVEKTVGSLGDIEKKVAGAIHIQELHERAQKEGKSMDVKNIEFKGKYLELFVAPIFLDVEHKEFLGTVILIEDQTEAKVMERSKEEFFSIASHELRTPLTAIRGNTSMILEYYGDALKDEQLKGMVMDIHESSIRLISIVNDFLETSRLEQGRIPFKNEPFDAPTLIEAVLKEYDVTGSRRKLYLRYEPPDTPVPLAYGDKDRVKQVIINLVGNALKFTEEGGVTVKVHLHDAHIRVIVEDTGRGIPYQNQMLLFRKFQQAGESLFTRDAAKGTGLGLYISKLIIEGMGGAIGLQYSRPGKGSAFAFSLPLAPGQVIPESKPPEKTEQPTPEPKPPESTEQSTPESKPPEDTTSPKKEKVPVAASANA